MSMFISDIGLCFFIFCGIFVWIWYQGDGCLRKYLRVFFLLQLLEEFGYDRYYLFSKCLIEFTCEAIWSWTFLLEDFKLQFQFLCL